MVTNIYFFIFGNGHILLKYNLSLISYGVKIPICLFTGMIGCSTKLISLLCRMSSLWHLIKSPVYDTYHVIKINAIVATPFFSIHFCCFHDHTNIFAMGICHPIINSYYKYKCIVFAIGFPSLIFPSLVNGFYLAITDPSFS